MVRGFCLDSHSALSVLLDSFNPRCLPPWSEKELIHKIEEAATKDFNKPVGWCLLKTKRDRVAEMADEVASPAPIPASSPPGSPAGPVTPNESATPAKPADTASVINEADDDPTRLARAFLASYYCDGKRTLQFWKSEFHTWTGTAYQTFERGTLRPEVNRLTRRELEAAFKVRLATFDADPEADPNKAPVLIKTTEALVTNIIGALEGLCLVRGVADAPAWIEGAIGEPPAETVAAANGLIHLPGYSSGKVDGMKPNTPHYLNFNSLTFAVDRNAPKPVEWLRTLATYWPEDSETIDLLQEWFGYLITPDNKHQKMLLLLGPKRAGKGTIQDLLQELVGVENCASPTLGSLGTQFGLSSLVGKSVAVIGDARLSQRTDTGIVIERLLTISGGGRIDIDRKNRDLLTTRLACRFVVATNEIPKLTDSSGALASRWSVVNFTKSFAGIEDKGLLGRLRLELAGIFNWAVDGYSRLRRQGAFTVPKSTADLIEDMENIGSPVGEFVRERCLIGRGFSVSVAEIYNAWRAWCLEAGRREPGTEVHFGRDIRAYVSGLHKSRRRVNGEQKSTYDGVKLRDRWDTDDAPLPHERAARTEERDLRTELAYGREEL